MSAKLRAKLKKVEDDLAQLRTERVEKVKARDTAREQWASSDDQTPDSEAFKSAEQAVRELGEIDDSINDLTVVQTGTLRMLGESSNGDDPAPQRDRETDEPIWNSKALFDGEAADRLKAVAHSSGRFGSIELGQVADREAVKAEIAGTTGGRRGEYQGAVSPLRRQLRVLDVIATGTMDGNSFDYDQEGGSYAAAETAEGSAKPEAGITLTPATASAKTVAHWKKIRKQALADQAVLRSIIDSHLRYGVMRRLEAQIINGDGSGENIQGILNTSGIQTVANAAGPLADLILSGITKIFLADGEADGVVLNPTDWQTVLTAKASGSGEYLAGGPFSTVASTIWGVPLLPSPAEPVGVGLVGDFGMGAQVFVREGVNVLLSDSDQDDFIKNRVTMLGEGRFALAVWRPVAFASVDFTP